jgi:hypothetical protein
VALLLNVIHKLDDDVLLQTLQRLRNRMTPTGRLIIRVPLSLANAAGGGKWKVFFDRICGSPTVFRSKQTVERILLEAGFRVDETRPSGHKKPLQWFVATPLRIRR